MTRASTIARRRGLSLGLLALAPACGIVVSGEELGGDAGVEADLAEYADWVETLEDDREQALDERAIAVTSAGTWLAWVEGEQLGLRRYPDRLELTLPAGDGYRVLPSAAVTVHASGEGLVLRSYALPEAEPFAESSLAAGPDEPFALALVEADGALAAEAWIVVGTQVWRWSLGAEPALAVGELAGAGIAAGQPRAFEAELVDGAIQLFVDVGGSLWQLDPGSWTAAKLTELDALLDLGEAGLLYTRGAGLYLRGFDEVTTRVDEAIVASGYQLNPTFASIHEYIGEGASLAEDQVLYIGSAGLFAFDLAGQGPAAITPLLLEPRWDVGAGIPRIEYREPRALGSFAVVRGLTGANGEVGEAGPIYLAPAG